jgi:hypothetical protein
MASPDLTSGGMSRTTRIRAINTGRVLHLKGVSREAFGEGLALLGVPAILLAEGRAWLSFITVGKHELEPAALSRAFDAPIVDIWKGTRAGVRFTWYEPDGMMGILRFGAATLGGEEAAAGAEPPLLLERLCRNRLLAASGRPIVASLLASGPLRGTEPEYVRLLSVAFNFPFNGVVPVLQSGNANARDVLDRLDEAVVVTVRARQDPGTIRSRAGAAR